jgi:solute carrier family 35 (UDP-xylose/UDP-N-acetylglucosamine transporter), member B4
MGVVLATLSKPSSPSKNYTPPNPQEYTIGIALLTAALFLTGFQGIVQYRVFEKYGPWWKEGMFYTVREYDNFNLVSCSIHQQHLMSLPIFFLYRQDIKIGLFSLSKSTLGTVIPYFVLGGNLASQLACTSGVHQLGSVRQTHPVICFPHRLSLTRRPIVFLLCRQTW